MNRKTAWLAVLALAAAAILVPALVPDRVPAEDAAIRSADSIISISIAAGGKTYQASVPEGSTVYEAMKAVSPEQDFQFSGTEHPTLGFYVQSIGNIVSEGGYYWTLYVNGEESDLGASNRRLSQGDVIEWAYEKR